MEYRGVTIRAEVASVDSWALDKNGELADWYSSGTGVEIIGYTFEGNGISEYFETDYSDAENLKMIVDDYLRERVLIGQDEQGYYTDKGYVTDKEVAK